MKLSITNPEVVDTFADFPGGLWPICRRDDSRMILVVKGAREMAHTAKLRGGFRFYLIPVHFDNVVTHGLLTAFFDDYDKPLVIRTPLFNEEITRDFLTLLSSDFFFVHFFEEHDRELLGFRAENPNAHRFRALSKTMHFVSPTLSCARHVLDEMEVWFGARSPSDDNNAFAIQLRESLYPDSLTEHVDNPGELNEPDIAAALLRSFGDAQVFKNPIRADNGREFVDVLVATTKIMLLIQAKDSPITESTLTRNIDRKKATSARHVSKATAQLKGSINYLRSCPSIEIFIEGKRRQVTMAGRDVLGLVIVSELFDPERPKCSHLVLTVSDETETPCLLLDHTEFQELTFFRTCEESFVATLREIFSAARAHGMFPRSRFGLRTDKTVVYQPRGAGNAPGMTAQEPVGPIAEGSHITTSQDSIASEVARMGIGEDLGADWLRVVIDRSEVEALDVSRTATVLSRVLVDRNTVERYRGRVDLAFLNYSNDTRELCEIPEVRRFCSKLDEAFPYWFYFLSTDEATLGVIASCLCSVTLLRPGVLSLGPDLPEFITRHYEALNWLVDNYSLDERHIVEISHNVFEYFNESEPIDPD